MSHPEHPREDAAHASAVEHLVICSICGQIFDGRDEASADHHAQPEHAPRLIATGH